MDMGCGGQHRLRSRESSSTGAARAAPGDDGANPVPARTDDRLATFALVSVALLLLLLAGYLFSSSILIENDCVLAGDTICVAALRRTWMAGGMASVFVLITGVVGAKVTLRGRRR